MATSNRAQIINNIYKVLKKHYQPISTPRRSMMESLLYACCLEDAPYATADECFGRLQESYFDWNEVRVTTVRELGEVFRNVPNATANALNLKNTLQSVFESQYAFDLEHLRKQNLGKAVALLESYKGTTPFTIAFVTQMNLSGHAIPLGKGGIDVMYIVGAIDEKEATAGAVPGLERAIPKTKGIEFASLLHQLVAELNASPFSQKVRSILLEINPECKPRLPKRVDKKKLEAERKKKEEEERKKQRAVAAAARKQAAAEKKAAAQKLAEEKRAARKKAAAKKSTKPAAQKKTAAAAKKATTRRKAKTTKKTSPAKKTVKKKTSAKKTGAKTRLVKKATKKTGKKSASKQLARRKPR